MNELRTSIERLARAKRDLAKTDAEKITVLEGEVAFARMLEK